LRAAARRLFCLAALTRYSGIFQREVPETGKPLTGTCHNVNLKNNFISFDLKTKMKQLSICVAQLHKNDQQTTCNLSIETKAGVGYNKIKQKRTPPKQKAEGDAEIQTPSVVGKELDPDGKD
jgi:hypothetical protein